MSQGNKPFPQSMFDCAGIFSVVKENREEKYLSSATMNMGKLQVHSSHFAGFLVIDIIDGIDNSPSVRHLLHFSLSEKLRTIAVFYNMPCGWEIFVFYFFRQWPSLCCKYNRIFN